MNDRISPTSLPSEMAPQQENIVPTAVEKKTSPLPKIAAGIGITVIIVAIASGSYLLGRSQLPQPASQSTPTPEVQQEVRASWDYDSGTGWAVTLPGTWRLSNQDVYQDSDVILATVPFSRRDNTANLLIQESTEPVSVFEMATKTSATLGDMEADQYESTSNGEQMLALMAQTKDRTYVLQLTAKNLDANLRSEFAAIQSSFRVTSTAVTKAAYSNPTWGIKFEYPKKVGQLQLSVIESANQVSLITPGTEWQILFKRRTNTSVEAVAREVEAEKKSTSPNNLEREVREIDGVDILHLRYQYDAGDDNVYLIQNGTDVLMVTSGINNEVLPILATLVLTH